MDTKTILKNLPEEFQKAITSPKVYENLIEIGKEFNLHIDQIGELDSETRLLMLGITKPNDYIKNIENRLEISKSDAEKIASEAKEKILLSVRHFMQDNNSEEPISKEQILDELENPVLAREESFEVKKEEKKVEAIIDTRNELPAPSKVEGPSYLKKIDSILAAPVTKKEYKIDPYREPINKI